MRKRSIGGAAAVAAIGTALLAPAGSGAMDADHDFAVGAGDNELALGVLGQASFTLSSHSDPDGGDPRGYVTAKGDPDGAGPLPPFAVQGEVTCLRVEGNRASIKWRFRKATGFAASLQGGGVQSFVEDNGQPRLGQPVDRAAIDPPLPAGAFQATEDTCDDPARPTLDRLDQGDVRVNDAIEG